LDTAAAADFPHLGDAGKRDGMHWRLALAIEKGEMELVELPTPPEPPAAAMPAPALEAPPGRGNAADAAADAQSAAGVSERPPDGHRSPRQTAIKVARNRR
jgi:hypothetical protein